MNDKNGNILLEDTISKEMKDASTAFRKLDNGEIVPIEYQRVNFHIIFDVKMEDIRHKARLVAGEHVIETPATIAYEIIVLRETTRIDLALDDLNDFPVKVADIQNAYSTAPVIEKIWEVLGQEFGEYDGRKAIVVSDLYVLKSAGATVWNHLAYCMHNLGFLPCPSDLYLRMKPMLRLAYEFDYYAYVLIYVENVMVIHNDADSVLRIIYNYFKLKPNSIVALTSI